MVPRPWAVYSALGIDPGFRPKRDGGEQSNIRPGVSPLESGCAASELYKHKVNKTSIQEALDSEISEQGYQENIHHLITKKRKELPASLDTFSLRNKLLAYLIQKGYEPLAITDILKEILRDNEP